ncbi:MAG: hypothetical protein WED04_08265 [Promethearchaeati archaeon SRVP18_Atabeyarchaeia-1]
MDDVSTISVVIASASVVAGVFYYAMILRMQNRQRQTDLLVRLAPWLSITAGELQQAFVRVLNLEFKDYDEFVKKYGRPFAEKPEQMAILTVGNYFDALGTLVRRGLLSLDLLCDYYGETFIMLIDKITPYAEGVMKELNQPEVGDNASYLYDEVKKRLQQRANAQ